MQRCKPGQVASNSGLGHRPLLYCARPVREAVVAGSSSASAGSYGRRQAPAQEANCGIFQLHPHAAKVTMLDVRDAVEACDISASPEQRRRCFETFGLDSRKVDAYYYLVQDLESHLDQDDEAGRRVAGAGSFMFFLLVCQKLL